ncbi:hypothetical protein MSR1_18120 [Magnetospirillum gryphiswaldense MSR-1]|uniref:Secreted protein n=3 Tax=Magnetospirillum gryphiswaldense TaxID=55518 RepID=A4TZH1_9PROT|nr:hypothetical protein MSR1_18120 [Magnetospirillum gryphiswaldense MSR-1]AVM78207.1 hypothetical protein MSR1L_18120 [Magnetospirillum gryphiswaldense]CAM76028.1 secreted protein [Magnetospirillum gryphiswaldense MSR-1]
MRMHSLIRISCVMLMATVASACTRLADSYQVDPVSKTRLAGPGVTASGKPDGTFKVFDLDNDSLVGGCGYKQAVDDMACRWRLMDFLIGLSEQRCSDHKARIESSAAVSDFGFSSVTTVLGGVGAIATGATTARVLAGSAGMVSGVHADWNESVYMNKVATAIVARIDANRAAILNELRTARESASEPNSGKVFTTEAMLAGIYRFHEACSFYSALSSMTQNAALPDTVESVRGRVEMAQKDVAALEQQIATTTDPKALAALQRLLATRVNTLNFLTTQLGVLETRAGSGLGAAPATSQ